ncbi:MAG: hypothetical protein P8P83_02415 [Rickettsiaceae bacterium]|nr:hypothetical protein [Rickettsiaceae bacterium]
MSEEYEIAKVSALLEILNSNAPNIQLSKRTIDGMAEAFVPTIAIGSTIGAENAQGDYDMIPDPNNLKAAAGEMEKYFSGITPNDTKDIVAGIFRVGGQTEQMYANNEAPEKAAHYIAVAFNKTENELIITDPLGSPDKVNDSYKEEINAIKEGFKKKFGDCEISINPKETTIFQGDTHSCGPVCLYNLERQLEKKHHTTHNVPTPQDLGIKVIDGILIAPKGADAIRRNQQDLLDFQRAKEESFKSQEHEQKAILQQIKESNVNKHNEEFLI